MMASNGFILGFNSPSAVCAANNQVLCGVGGGVVIRRGSDSAQWVPGDGKYPIGKLAYSPALRLLCVTEVRLNVTLHAFRYPEYNRVHKVENFARVDVEDMLFSPNGQVLAVLTCMPSVCVSLFSVQRGRSFEKCASVDLTDKFWRRLVFSPQRADCLAVLESREVAVVSHLSLPGSVPSILTLGSPDHELHSFSWGACGVLCGAAQGKVVLFDELKMEVREYLTCPTKAAVTSILHTKTLLLIGTEDGALFGYGGNEKDLRLLLDVKYRVERLLLSETGGEVVIVSKVDINKLDLSTTQPTPIRVRSTSNTVKILTLGGLVVLVCSDGTLVRYDGTNNTVTRFAVQLNDKALDACTIGSYLVVAYQSGCARSFTMNADVTLVSHTKLGDAPLSLCTSDDASFVTVSDGNVIHLITVENGSLFPQGSVDTFTSSVMVLRWITGEERSVLAVCSNGEVHLLRCFDSDGVEPATMIVDTVWRLDYPVHDLLPLYFDDDVVNILVHSLDKDTKVYVLERRRERDAKPLRPLFLMRDHESGGTVLQRFGATCVISGGGDGKVIVRDVSHYLLKLTPIPPSKEKRRPQYEFPVRPMGKGGVTSLCVWNDGGGFVCGGGDTVVHLIPSGDTVQYSWTEPMWCEENLSGSLGAVTSSVDEVGVVAEQSRSNVMSALAELRLEIDKLLIERSSAVHVEDFLLPDQREVFRSDCDSAIQQAKEDDYYQLLLNEFTQHTIRRECWDTMEVPRSKIVSLNTPSLEVHNFHRRKADPEAESLLKKMRFMRMMQIKDGSSFTFSSLVKRTPSAPQFSRSDMSIADDTLTLLYDALDVYTSSRAVIQMVLLGGRISAVKVAFNARFDSLRERKNRELRRIEERNDRCKRIMRQLGESFTLADVLFTPLFDKEEDPTTVFEVFDSELDPELLKLAKQENDAAYVISPSDEAALKTWMDGLEKDAEVLAVKVPLPAFADETSEQYVVPDERTEEQVKAYDEYEKELAEQTAYYNERKDALREEMVGLLKASVVAAGKVDEEISALRKQRMEVSQSVDELESHQVNALRRLLLQSTIRTELLCLIREKIELQNRLNHLQSLEAYRRKLLVTEESKLQQSIDAEKALAAEMRASPPFNDNEWGDRLYRRFTRWRTKYEEGVAKVPVVEQPDTVPVALWERFCDCCLTIVKAKDTIARIAATIPSFSDALAEAEAEVVRVHENLEQKEAAEEACRQGVTRRILDVQNLYCLRQGQVQDEDAVVNADFLNFSFRWAKDILKYNDLIFSSFDELRRLMGKISQQRQAMKLCSWETERLQYCVGTLEMELRQLHTLRVTRQMQESIHTGAGATREDEVDKLNRRMEYVRCVMSKKVEERNRVITRLKMQIHDRNIENTLLDNQVRQVRSIVDDKKVVWGMLGEHNNEETRLHERMRELYENSELEELARCQQEELVRLKREIDRLRERTFPSFAVVSKKTVK
ncbi:WD repeat-containing protein 96 [Trypanosoma grayi]|uniref:WD repeat-containing protein 96 n=1 Tax=Trypanosoma grayi TaxID=71804 RepID=UPI0004F44B6A|nr:WD repeat-containing protein 96 [Trypanosoma grayi]KEG14024.1 WD repeat-containing protein 96 [Trypanosoma grayi]